MTKLNQGHDVSIVIVSFNTRDVLRECLENVRNAAGALAVQTIVIDNNSRDGSPEMVATDFPEVVLVRSAINLGFGPANNEAFRHATGRYVVLLNSDAFLNEDTLRVSVELMDANPKVGLAGGQLIGRDGSWQPSARMFPSVLNDLLAMSGLAARFPKSKFFGRADRTWANPMQAAEVDWVPGAYSIIRADALDQMGYFDPRFFLYYEEVDLCKRLKQLGYAVWYWPQIIVIHIGGESSRTVDSLHLTRSGAQLTLWRMRSMLLYYRKHHGVSAWMALFAEGTWYSMRSLRRRLSLSSRMRDAATYDITQVEILKQAWNDTRGGRFSPEQPW